MCDSVRASFTLRYLELTRKMRHKVDGTYLPCKPPCISLISTLCDASSLTPQTHESELSLTLFKRHPLCPPEPEVPPNLCVLRYGFNQSECHLSGSHLRLALSRSGSGAQRHDWMQSAAAAPTVPMSGRVGATRGRRPYPQPGYPPAHAEGGGGGANPPCGA